MIDYKILLKDVNYMQPTAYQQYLARLNKDLICHFFLCNDEFLYCNTYSSDNILLNSNKLLSNIINFSVTVDRHEKIHLICITSEGELQYYINKNNNWSYKTISNFDVRSNIYRYLTLYVNDEYTHILYVKTNLLTQALSSIEHMYWDKKNANRIMVNDYVHGNYAAPFRVSVDNSKNLHIVYKIFYKDNHQLYYNKFNASTKLWTINELITDLREDHSHPYILIDNRQNLHLVWCTIEKNNFTLKYKKKHDITCIKPEWSDVQTLSDRDSNYFSPILIQESDILKIYCRQNDNIIEITSDDFGDSWTNPIDSEPYIIEDPEIIQYSGNPNMDDEYLAKHVYGNIKDKIRIIGINIFTDSEENVHPQKSASDIAPGRKQGSLIDDEGEPAPVQPSPNQIQDPLTDGESEPAPVQPSPNQIQDPLTDSESEPAPVQPSPNQIQDPLTDSESEPAPVQPVLEPVQSPHQAQCSPMDADTNTGIKEVKYIKCETGQNNEIIDPDESDDTQIKIVKPGDVTEGLISDYNILEKQFIEIKERKRRLAKSIDDYEVDLSLLEEKITDYKKQILAFQEKLNNVTLNNGIFQRFFSFFK